MRPSDVAPPHNLHGLLKASQIDSVNVNKLGELTLEALTAGPDKTEFDILLPLVAWNLPWLHRFIERSLPNGREAWEEPQDVEQHLMLATYLKAPTVLQKLREQEAGKRAGQLKAWLATVALNGCRNVHRRRKFFEAIFSELEGDDLYELSILELIESAEPRPEDVIEREEQSIAIKACIAELPEKYARIVSLRMDPNGYTFVEIGHMLEMPIGTVKTYFQRAMARLGVILREQGVDLD